MPSLHVAEWCLSFPLCLTFTHPVCLNCYYYMCSHFAQLEKNEETYIQIFNPLLELHMSGSVTAASFLFVQ